LRPATWSEWCPVGKRPVAEEGGQAE
jgi:hypothetical protein